MKIYEKTVHGEWQTSKEPSERKGEIERGEGQRTGKHFHLGMSTLEKNMLFTLHIIMGITEVTGRRNNIIPSG
eukprot:1157347-Pelagomonas_calceolata.AAC.7